MKRYKGSPVHRLRTSVDRRTLYGEVATRRRKDKYLVVMAKVHFVR